METTDWDFGVNNRKGGSILADSNITKRALASALKDLMEEIPFEKINVVHICERCNMNRKSFYYHFKDKYDLVNWIFDTEFLPLALSYTNKYDDREECIMAESEYFYRNRNFYRKALQIKGQNSFSDHFREFCMPLLRDRLMYLCGEEINDDFILNFYTDAVICAIERWLLDNDCMPPELLVYKLKHSLELSRLALGKELNLFKNK